MSTLKTTNVQHPSAADPAIELDAAGKLWLAGGKVLQIVRATDSTGRSTNSTSFADAGISVTITPQSATSVILLNYYGMHSPSGPANSDVRNWLSITDSANTPISGAQSMRVGLFDIGAAGTASISVAMNAYATPATTSAVTYKLRWKVAQSNVTGYINNDLTTGQMYAIEVSA